MKNQPIINIENGLKRNSTKLSSGDYFNIKDKKARIFKDIELNELTILNKNKIKKKKRDKK